NRSLLNLQKEKRESPQKSTRVTKEKRNGGLGYWRANHSIAAPLQFLFCTTIHENFVFPRKFSARRSAPVLGRSHIRPPEGWRTVRQPPAGRRRCARGRAHSSLVAVPPRCVFCAFLWPINF